MQPSRFITALTLALTLASCTSISGVFKKGGSGPDQVDDLLTRIERVQNETELSRESMRNALNALRTLVSPKFDGDPMAAYATYEQEIEKAKERAKELDRSVDPMKSAAGPFFENWSANLNSFASPAMRQRSQQRLEETRARYQAIVDAIDPARTDFAAFNSALGDHALFLGQDFNAQSVLVVQAEVQELTAFTKTLDGRFAKTLAATQDYVSATALRGQLEEAEAAEPDAK